MKSYFLLLFCFLLVYTSTNVAQSNPHYSSIENQSSAYSHGDLSMIIQGSYYGKCETAYNYGDKLYTKYNIQINSNLLIVTAIFQDGESIKESGEYSFTSDSNKDEGQIKVFFSDNTKAELNYFELNGLYYLVLDKSYCNRAKIILTKDSDLTDGELEFYNLNKLKSDSNLNKFKSGSIFYLNINLSLFDKQDGFSYNEKFDGYTKENVQYWDVVAILPNEGAMMFYIYEPTVADWLLVTEDLQNLFGKETQKNDVVPITINDVSQLPLAIKLGQAVYKRLWEKTNTDVGSLILLWYTEGILLVTSKSPIK